MPFVVKYFIMVIGVSSIVATIVEGICWLFDRFYFNPKRNKKYEEKVRQTEEWLAKWGA